MAGADITSPPPSSFEAIKTDNLTKEPAKNDWKNQPTPKTAEEWIARAKEVAKVLAVGVQDVRGFSSTIVNCGVTFSILTAMF